MLVTNNPQSYKYLHISASLHVGEHFTSCFHTLKQLKWVVELADEKSKVIGIIISDLHIIAKVR